MLKSWMLVNLWRYLVDYWKEMETSPFCVLNVENINLTGYKHMKQINYAVLWLNEWIYVDSEWNS